jgi:D-aminopeptidase
VIAFSTANRVRHGDKALRTVTLLPNDAMPPLFLAAIEATEEAIINSMLRATTTTGNGRTVEALPIEPTKELLRKHGLIP